MAGVVRGLDCEGIPRALACDKNGRLLVILESQTGGQEGGQAGGAARARSGGGEKSAANRGMQERDPADAGGEPARGAPGRCVSSSWKPHQITLESYGPTPLPSTMLKGKTLLSSIELTNTSEFDAVLKMYDWTFTESSAARAASVKKSAWRVNKVAPEPADPAHMALSADKLPAHSALSWSLPAGSTHAHAYTYPVGFEHGVTVAVEGPAGAAVHCQLITLGGD